MIRVILIALLTFPTIWAKDFCKSNLADIKLEANQFGSRIQFANFGGLFGGGVCWWHSRLQRAALYLTRFKPDAPKPTLNEAKQLIRNIKRMHSVVEIPGYSDFLSFSRDYAWQVQGVLESWQIWDGFINQEWIRGLSGRSQLTPAKLKKNMDQLYAQLKSSEWIEWVMVQMKGIYSHSFLVLSMYKTSEGYLLEVIDSNEPVATVRVTYKEGQSAIRYDGENVILYPGFSKDLRKIKAAREKYCRNSLAINQRRN